MKYLIWFILVFVALSNLGYATDTELETAVSWMYDNGLTKFNTVESFSAAWNLTREQAAKFFTNFGVAAIDNFQWFNHDNDCNFSDIGAADPTLAGSIQSACNLGIFKWSQWYFYPQQYLTQWQAIAVALRLMIGIQNEDRDDPWHTPYFAWGDQLQLLRLLAISASTADHTVTRTDTAKLLYRIYQLLSRRQESVTTSSLVYVDYVGKFKDWVMFDTSIESEARKWGIYDEDRSYSPLWFVVGWGMMIDWFDQWVVGMKMWQTKTITISPAGWYGEPKPELFFTTWSAMFYEAWITPELGDTYNFGWAPGTITAINWDQVTLDFNHALAGKDLIFTITVLDSYGDLWSNTTKTIKSTWWSYVSSGECDIKWNINRDKKKLYHYPWCKDYVKTKITESSGEQWFCSEEEAISAWWAKAENC